MNILAPMVIFFKKTKIKMNKARCIIAFLKFLGTPNWHQGQDKPTLYQRWYEWRIGPRTAWDVAAGIWLG